MKQSKGFSLIELLAVIVILAIVAVITTPLVLNTINDVKKRSFTSTAYGIIKAAEMEYTNQMIKGNNNETIFTYVDGEEKANRIGPSLKYKGERPKNGTVIINSEGKIAIAIHNGTFCSEKSFEESVVITSNKTKEECVINYDLSKNLFTKTFGGSDSDYFRGVTTTNDGYVAVGESYSNDYDLEGLNKGEKDAIVVKYDLSGNVVWKKTFGGSDYDYFYGVTTTNDGYVAVGYSDSIDYDLEGLNKGFDDAIIVKYDFNGNVIWKKTFGGSDLDYFYGVTTTSDGYVAVGGSYSNDYDLEGLNKRWRDAIIVKYDLNGNVVWKKTFGGSNHEDFFGVTTTSDGYVAVGGSSSYDYDLEGLNKGFFTSDAIIVKYDLNGNVVWKKTFGGSDSEDFFGVATTSDGYVAVGESWSNDKDLEGLNKGEKDAIVVKYDFNGNVIWKKTFGGSFDDYFDGVTTTSDGYVAVGGSYSNDYDLEGLNKGYKRSDDAIIVKYDFNGNVIWKKTFGGSDYEYFDGVTTTSDGYVAVGYSFSNDYDLEGLNKGWRDAIIVKYDLNGNFLDSFDPSQRVYTIQEVPYMYESATTYLGDDLVTSYEIQLDFDLNYGGKVYNKIYAATSGHLAFSDMTEDWYSNIPLSNVGIPFIAVYWDDLNFYKENSGIYYKQGIENGVKYLLVEYRDVSLYDGSENETANFEVKIYENGDILMSYQNVDFGNPELNNGLTAVVGIKTYYHGTYQYLAYERLLGPNKSILFK